MLPESNPGPAELAVCGTRSLFTHTKRSPRCAVTAGGLTRMFSITTTWVSDAHAASAGTIPRQAVKAQARTQQPARKRPRGFATTQIWGLPTVLAQFGLQVLGMFKVLDKRRPYLDEEPV